MLKKRIFLIVRIAVLIICIIYLVYTVDLRTLIDEVLNKLPVWILGLSVLLSVFTLWLNGIRWKIANTDIDNRLSNWDYFRYMMISSSFKLVMPGVLGGDIVKAFWVGSDLEFGRTRNILSILFDRVIGMFSIIILGSLAFSLSPFFPIKSKIAVWIILVVIFISTYAIVWFLKKESFKLKINNWNPKKSFSVKIKNSILISHDIVLIYIKKPRIIFIMLLLSFIMHSCSFSMSYLIASFLGIDLSFLDISAVSSLTWLITTIPISISGIGVREISYIKILGYYGISNEAATGLSLYIFLVIVITSIIGFPFVLLSKRKN